MATSDPKQPDSDAFADAIRRVWPDGTAPQAVHDRVHAALDGVDSSGMTNMRVVRAWWTVPAAMAAALLLAFLVWSFSTPGDGRQGANNPPLLAQAVADFQQRHLSCQSGEVRHHDPSLPATTEGIREQLAARLKLDVLAPDFPPGTCKLVGANACQVGEVTGAHVTYRLPDGQILSVFSMPVCNLTGDDSVMRINREFIAGRVGPVAAVGWRGVSASHVLCADLEMDRLLDLAVHARMTIALQTPSYVDGQVCPPPKRR